MYGLKIPFGEINNNNHKYVCKLSIFCSYRNELPRGGGTKKRCFTL